VAAFAACPRPVRRQLAAHTDVLRPPPGTVLARQGATAREVVVVVAGEVAVARDGRPAPPLGAGATLGAEAVLAGGPHAVTAVAGPGVELRVVNGPAYRAAAPYLA
jgi:CRP-like cAMP-binding protein